ncbi:hypothetical protein [Ferrimonas lipolytica]|uniref:Uncharacterized protein n=1 Tax=Ferrimonas lipolytica TaxID=2724191 RepID=A0A6H1UGW8_9GAMM|nr:hypothetical protein [Ferrimonas lipolytica]QIZ78331.1 hypothetical protein HER31_16355 [Ferrimonas lipolytica]
MMKLKYLPLLIGAVLITGCGSDNSNEDVTQPVITPPAEQLPQTGSEVFDNVWGPDVQFELNTPIYVYLETNTREDMLQQFQGGTPPNAIQLDPAHIRELLPTLWTAEEFEQRVFNDNQINFADVLLYMGATRDDFHVDYQWGEDIATYRYWVSYDKNGDGDFDDEGDYKADPDWYASYMINFGEFRREVMYDSRGEALYMRLDLAHIQPDSGVLLRPNSAAMTKRREAIHKEEATRRHEAEAQYGANTVVFPRVEVTPIGQEMMVFEDVVATPHNLRPDIYKKDKVITLADVLLSMDAQGLIDIGYTFWGRLATDVDVQHFYLNEVNGQKAYGSVGYTFNTRTSWSANDFNAKYITAMVTLGAGTKPSYCDWTGQDDPYGQKDANGNPLQVPDGKLDLDNPECNPELTGVDIDISDWFVDKESHIFTDVWVVNYPGDSFEVFNTDMYGLYAENDSKRVGGDEKFPIHDINEAKKPLTETHFGWGIADCGNCHSLQGIHSDGDMGTLGVNPTPIYIRDDVTSYTVDDNSQLVVAPYQCAQCHGSNGAPEGHGEIARCFWCHSEDVVPPNHGPISVHTTYGEIASEAQPGGNDPMLFIGAAESIDVPTTDADAVAELERELQAKYFYLPYAENIRFDMLAPHEGVSWQGNWGFYPDEMKVRTNSDWFTDAQYPDPYSCMTCHPNKD